MNNAEDNSYLWCGNCHKNGATFTVVTPTETLYLCDSCVVTRLIDSLEKSNA